MKVILKENVKSLGKAGDVVEVSDGYARNMLLPKKLAVEATSANMNALKLQNKYQEKVAQENLDAAEELKKQLEPCSVTIPIRAGEGGRVFGSVSAQNIADAAKEQIGLELDKKKIQLTAPIKELGEQQVEIRLHPQVTASLKVNVVSE
ncbi:MAG: 50S ribosomal protein L9 [Eubacterium sp.]|nr:50S ribosomal protein L9 [Eubacterium sp.]